MTPDWIAIDWGTTRLRAWAMGPGGTVLAEAQSDDGMATLERDGFQPALLSLVEPWLGERPTRVIACGMVGSRQGWAEAPYVAVPTKPGALDPVAVAGTDRRIAVSIVPGLKQADPPEVMRGEETQIAGFLSLSPGFDGVLCLPGTHTKWVQVSAGEVVSFRTAMTGELFDLLAHRSVLRHSVGEGMDQQAFLDAVGDALSRPEALAQRLFGIRAAHLLAGTDASEGGSRLSGLLIGSELAATRPYWLGQAVAVIGAPAIAGLYARALGAQAVAVSRAEADEMTRRGLAAYHAKSRETAS